MKKISLFTTFLILLTIKLPVNAQNNGEELFKSVCIACHTINQGRLIGPDLTGIYNLRETDWLVSFIRSSKAMIKAGDPDAVAIFNEYNKIPMPDNKLTDEQIRSIIEYIRETDQGSKPSAEQQKTSTDSLTAGDSVIAADSLIAGDSLSAGDSLTTVKTQPGAPPDSLYTVEMASEGRSLFNGNTQFVNNGAPCMSCHNIRDQSIYGGGKIALDLTFSYSKLGPAGLSAILTNPPFPVMQVAMQNHPLTENEVSALISLLRSVDERNMAYKIKGGGGSLFFALGCVSALFILVHVFIFYDNRNIPDLNI